MKAALDSTSDSVQRSLIFARLPQLPLASGTNNLTGQSKRSTIARKYSETSYVIRRRYNRQERLALDSQCVLALTLSGRSPFDWQKGSMQEFERLGLGRVRVPNPVEVESAVRCRRRSRIESNWLRTRYRELNLKKELDVYAGTPAQDTVERTYNIGKTSLCLLQMC